MTKIYIAFYDEEEGGSRENWNTFYTPWVASTTLEGARRLAQQKIKELVEENILDEFDVDLKTVTIDEIDDEELREEVRETYEYWMKDGYHIEIQEGELQ